MSSSNAELYQTLQALVDAEGPNTDAAQDGESASTNDQRSESPASGSEQARSDSEDLPDCDADELVNLFECEYCGASLLPPSDPDGQPLEYCANDKCGMPSGIPNFKDWSKFCD